MLRVKDYLVQLMMTPGHRLSTGSEFYIFLPNKTLAGNCLVLGVTNASDKTITGVSDDVNGAWGSAVENPIDAVQTDAASAYVFPNSAAGVRKITVTFSGQASFMQFYAMELRQIATTSPVDVSVSQATSGPSVSSGSMTPTQDGDFIFSIIKDTAAAVGYTTIKADPTLFDGQILACDSLETGWTVQAGIQLVAAAINPTITLTGSGAPDSFVSLSVALKTSAGAGTAPPTPGPNTAPRIIRVVGYNLAFNGSTFKTIFPCSGSVIHASYVGADGTTKIPILKSATDSHNNVYNVLGGVTGATQGAGDVNFAYTHGSTPGDQLVITWVMSKSATINSTIVLYDIEGAEPIVMPVSGAVGTDATGAPISMLTLKPQVPNTLSFIAAGVEGGSLEALSGSSFFNDNCYWLEEDATVVTFYENNGWGHVTSTDTSTLTFTWTPTSATTNWTAKAISYSPVRTVLGRQLVPALRR